MGTFDWRNRLQVDLPFRMAQHDPSNGDGTDLTTDGDMEASGTASWTAGNSATLSKESGTRTGGVGSQVLRVTRNGVNNPYTRLTASILTIGRQYRITGWARSDTNVAPSVLDSGAVYVWTGTTSGAWESFDAVFTAVGTNPYFWVPATIDGQYCEFDDVRVELLESRTLNVGQLGRTGPQLLADGDMERADVGAWTALSATLTKDTGVYVGGAQSLKNTTTGAGNGAARQSPLTVGTRYHATGYARGDGSGYPRVYNAGTLLWTGAPTASWQYFDLVFTAGAVEFDLYTMNGGVAGRYTHWDNVSVTEVGTHAVLADGYTAASMPTKLDYRRGYSFDGSADYMQINGDIQEAAAEFCLLMTFIPSWASNDGSFRYLWSDADLDYQVYYRPGDTSLRVWFGGTQIVIAFATFDPWWRQNQFNTFVMTGKTGDNQVWLNEGLILDDTTAWTPSSPTEHFIGGETTNTAWMYGQILHVGVGNLHLTPTQAAQYDIEMKRRFNKV